jgi:hypothetical protein
MPQFDNHLCLRANDVLLRRKGLLLDVYGLRIRGDDVFVEGNDGCRCLLLLLGSWR